MRWSSFFGIVGALVKRTLLVAILLWAPATIPSSAVASERSCLDVLEVAHDLARFEEAVRSGDLDSQKSRALRRKASEAEELGSLIATDEEISAEERQLGERLTTAAVSLEAAGPYKERLLPLPGFLAGRGGGGKEEIAQGLALTAYFLERNIFHPQDKPLPPARLRLASRFPGRLAREDQEGG